ncbi:helix-turn-helix domain-containing protein [Spirillospora sp. CA-294931]|uniref:PucR family transcriptional regulator n=1 Tax=Spirillospora sp. CA-294931 TaxID=3240042 RepID=UPI003D8D7A10
MTRTLDREDDLEPAAPLPPRLARLMRPELPGLAEEIVTEIRRGIPEYARPIDGPYGQVLRLSVEQNLASFVDRIEIAPGAPTVQEGCATTARKLGQYEAHEGRSMDLLQAAYRIGGQVAWRRIMRVAPKYDISSVLMSRLADAVFVYLDELAAHSLDGYQRAKANPIAPLDEKHRKVLRKLLEGPASGQETRELADDAGWTIPAEVTLVAMEPDCRCVWTALDEDVLAELEGAEPHLLIPGPFTTARREMLERAVPGRRVAVGLTVAAAQAADSLRWARQALGLVREGVLPGDAVTLCEQNMVTLWLLSDPALVEQLTRRQLSILDTMTPGQQDRLTETLRTWLVTRGTTTEIAERLHLHPQTVRYRMRKIEQTFGKRLDDPEARFGIEVVLRAMSLWARRPADGTR